MNKERFLFLLKAFILLSPLPYGCVARIWSPLFYLCLLLFSAFSLNLATRKETILFEYHTRKALMFLLIFIIVQMIPLPRFLLDLLSSKTVEILDRLGAMQTGFHSISVLPAETLGFLFRLFVVLFFFRVLIRIQFKLWEIYSLLNTFLVSVSIQALIGLVKYFQGNTHFFIFFKEVKVVPSERFLVGTIANPGHFSFYLELAVPVACVLLLVRLFSAKLREKEHSRLHSVQVRRDEVLLTVAVIVLAGSGIVLSGSRLGIVVLIMSLLLIACGLLYILSPPDMRRNIGMFTLGMALAVIVFAIFQGDTTFTNPHTMSGVSGYKAGTEKILGAFPLFGGGFGTFRYLYLLYDHGEVGWLTHAHNEFMETMAEGGILGGIIFLVPLGMMFASLFMMWTKRNHPEIRMVGMGILAALTAAAVHSFHDFALRIPANVFLVTLLAVLGFKLVTYKDRMLYHGNQSVY